MSISREQDAASRHGTIDYWTMGFLFLTPVIGVVGTALYTFYNGLELWMPLLFLGMYLAVGLSICAGYHRFYSHKSYEASRPVQVFYALFGGMAAQNSILWWSASHRLHHQYVDHDWDPYNIKRGFWWAHIVWVFTRHEAPDLEKNASDLLGNPVVRWQSRWYKVILIVGGFGLPTAIGAMFGDAIAGLLWGGFLRLVVIHHTTFFVNSLAHYLGRPTFNADVSARDNWAVALLTLGEGYHSFHHRFPADFRNGIRWYHWDPAKWFIGVLRLTGLASALRSTPPPQVERARMTARVRLLESSLASRADAAGAAARQMIEDATRHLDEAFALWRTQLGRRGEATRAELRAVRRSVRERIREARRSWSAAIELLSRESATIDGGRRDPL